MKIHAFAFLFLIASAAGALAQDWNPYTALTKAGMSFPVTYTGEVLGNPVGGYRQGAIYDGLLEAGVQADLGTLAHWQGATFTADAFYPHGSSLTRNDTHDLNVASTIDTFHNPRLYELWLQQALFGGKLSIRVGQLPMDTEFFQNAYGSLFINSAFGALPTISLNMNAPVYPAAAPGVRLMLNPDNNWTFLAGVFDGNTGDLDGVDRYGTNFNFDERNGALWITEADYTLNPPPAAPTDGKNTAPATRPLSGIYEVGAFLNTADFTNIRTGGTLHGDYGAYAVAEQELWHVPGAPDEGLRGFCRCGCVPNDRNQVPLDFESGLNYAGLIPGHAKDQTGLGFAYTKTIESGVDDAPARHYESIVELTYLATVNDHLTVQPDVQLIINPSGGVQRLDNALVLGMRFNMTF